MPSRRYLSISFLIFGLILILAAILRPFISDELHEAWTVMQLLDKTPYAEELYYKNVLGYYLKLPFLLIFKSWWTSLVASRIVLAAVFIGTIYLLIGTLKKYFDAIAIALGLLIFAFFTENITHATSYRVDMLTACFGVFSLLAIYRSKYALAGLLAGLSFLISQKGAYYCICGFLAISLVTKDLRATAKYTLAGLATGAVYVIFWLFFADLGVILHTIFIKDTMMITQSGYQIQYYWPKSFIANPVFWITALLSIGYLLEKQNNNFEKINLIYIPTLFILCFLNGQPWPYFFVLLSPFMLINICDFFNRLFIWRKNKVFIYGFASLGIIISSYHLIRDNTLTNFYQKYNLMLMESILHKGDTYLAGFSLHKDFKQAHTDFTWLNAINRNKLRELPPEEKTKIVDELKKNPAKILIYNYRFEDLDPAIRTPLFKNYEHLWANIYIYSLKLTSGENISDVKFDGEYVISSTDNSAIEYNGKTIPSGARIHLHKGLTNIRTKADVTLKLIPKDITSKLDLRYYKPRSLNFTYDF